MTNHNLHDSIDSVLTEGFIVGESGGSWCEIHPLHATEKLTVGRDKRNDIVISDDRCSRRHCVILKIEENWYVSDLGSSNGTFVNGNRIARLQRLRPGDRIGVASQRLLYAATVIDPAEIIADLAPSGLDVSSF